MFYKGEKVLSFIEENLAKGKSNGQIAEELEALGKKDAASYAWGAGTKWNHQKVSQVAIKHKLRRASKLGRPVRARTSEPVFQDFQIKEQPTTTETVLMLIPLNKLTQVLEILK